MGDQEAAAKDGPSDRVKKLGPPQNVPVFNCLVAVSPRNAEGLILARAIQVDGISATAKTEPEALKAIVAAFKSLAGKCAAAGEEIPWLKESLPLGPGDQQRFIAVHL